MRRILLFDRLGNTLGELPEADVFAAIQREEINGEHSLEITTTQVLEKGIRLLYKDGRSKWHEFSVMGIDAEHASGNRAIGTYYCAWSVQEDLSGVTVSVMPGVQSPTPAATALDALLSSQSRWTRGTVTRMALGGASMYDRSAWEALKTLVEVWGGEVDATITVGVYNGVTGRSVDLYEAQGEQDAKRRFDFGHDLQSVKRIMSDNPLYCRISPRGKGEETDTGGYGRKITIESVNDGKDYLEYAPMVDAAKLPDGNGGFVYPTLIVENSDCETPADLLTWAQSVLALYCTPEITYEIDVLQAGIEGVDFSGVSLGDAVQIVDRKFGGDGIRMEGRVRSITTDLLNERDISIVVGDAQQSVAAQFASMNKSLETVNNDLTVMSTAQYIENLLDRINADINATGGYTYIVSGYGIRTYDVAVSDPTVGTEASQVVEIKGGSIRIANSKTSGGEWEWKTVFTSGHIAAELVSAVAITSGYIGNASNTSYWDIDNGQMIIRGGVIQSTIGSTGTINSSVVWKRFAITTFGSDSDAYGFEVKRPTENSWIGIFPAVTEDADDASAYHWGSIIASGRLVIAAHGNVTDSNYGYIKLTTDTAYLGVGPLRLGSFSRGFYATSTNIRLQPTSNRYIDVNSTNIAINGTTAVTGSFSVSGTKNRLVSTDSYSKRLLYSYETAEPMFGDIGSGVLDSTGYCYVSIDDVFSETARTDISYQVFLQACGSGALYVESKSSTYFVVRGEPGLAFDWEIKCKQRDYELIRIEQPDTNPDYMDNDSGDDFDDVYMDEYNFAAELERILYGEHQAA